jgi:hypothetical protein
VRWTRFLPCGSGGAEGRTRAALARALPDRRGQANLVAVTVALVLVASVLGASVAVAESALVGATTARDPGEARAAATLAARLADDTPDGYPRGVIANRSGLSDERVDGLVPSLRGAAVGVELDGRTLLRRGDPASGTTVHRAVLVGRATDRTLSVDLADEEELPLPDRTGAASLDLRPGPNTTVHTVRVNGRVVLHDPAGLSGTTTVPTSVRRTTALTFETSVTPSNATGPTGRVAVSYATVSGDPATLAVTVDA